DLLFSSLHPTATTALSTLSLHDALPISHPVNVVASSSLANSTSITPPSISARRSSPWIWTQNGSESVRATRPPDARVWSIALTRSEEHTSELQSCGHLVCRLLLEKKKAE